jgi:hypothetical protein
MKVHLISQSAPIEYHHVENTYTKDGLYCVMFVDTEKNKKVVHKFPLVNIFRIEEDYNTMKITDN